MQRAQAPGLQMSMANESDGERDGGTAAGLGYTTDASRTGIFLNGVSAFNSHFIYFVNTLAQPSGDDYREPGFG
ncbi:hypothetical protein GCM10011513_11640 [Franconibacter daqui]|nr:hypothetical protein GCM10011513_11640 [Franconibacter daqui]